LIDNPLHAGYSRKLGLFDQAQRIVQRHSPKCARTCCDLFHPGEPMPEFGGHSMISVISASTSNYALVAAASPPPVNSTTSSGYDSASSSSIGSSSSSAAALVLQHGISPGESIPESSTFLLQNGIFPSEEPQQHHPASAALDEGSIYINPGLMDSCVSDIAVDAFVTANPDLFLAERLEWLSSSKDFTRHFTFIRLLQHWAVQEGIHVKALTRLLGLLAVFKPETISYKGFPRDGRTLLKIPKAASLANAHIKQQTFLSVEKIVPVGTKKEPRRVIGKYVHFGLEDALTGTSIGLVHRFHYITLLRRIHTVFPFLLPDDILELTKPSEDEPYDKTLWVNWLLEKARQKNPDNCEPVIFEVKINVDGVQWFKSSKVKGTPILGKIIAIRTLSGKTRVKIPYNLAKPFVIGIHEQIEEKPPAEVLMKDTLDELVRLQPLSLEKGQARESASYAVEVACFSCDGPMRCELKGIKYMGYWSCERCRTKGVYLNKQGVEIAKQPKKLTRKQQADVDRRLRVKHLRIQLALETAALETAARGVRGQQIQKAAMAAARKRKGSPLQEEEHRDEGAAKKRRTNPSRKRKHQQVLPAAGRLLANSTGVSHSIVRRYKRSKILPKRSTVIPQPTAVVRVRQETVGMPAEAVASGAVEVTAGSTGAPTVATAATAAGTATSAITAGPSRKKTKKGSSGTATAAPVGSARVSTGTRKKTNKEGAGTAPKKGAGGHRGSTYFPDVQAFPRRDAKWKYYRLPEVRFDVSTQFYKL
jgi:hypothetical protein